jgi:hypothetical protein
MRGSLFVYSISVYMSLRLCKTSGYVAATFLALCSSSPSTLGFPPSNAGVLKRGMGEMWITLLLGQDAARSARPHLLLLRNRARPKTPQLLPLTSGFAAQPCASRRHGRLCQLITLPLNCLLFFALTAIPFPSTTILLLTFSLTHPDN